MRHIALALIAPLVLAGGCVSVGSAPSAPDELTTADSAYGMFLAGSSALAEGRGGEASRFLEMAQARGADDPVVAERAFTAALLAGDVTRAAAIAPSGPLASEPNQRLGRLVKATDALARGRGKDAKAILDAETIGFPHRAAVALLTPWIAAAAGDKEGMVVRPQLRGDAAVDYFGQIGQAHLFERVRRYDEAETDFKAVTAAGTPSDLALVAYGAFLERRGRRAEAVELYEGGLKRRPGNVALRKARERAVAVRRPPAPPTIRQGAAFALLTPAAGMLGAKQDQVALAYLRMAIHLDPARYDAWLMVGDVLQQAGDIEGARAAYGMPGPDTAEFPAAQAKLAWTYQSAGDKAGALKLAQVAAAEGDADARRTYADILRANEDYAAAIPILSDLIAEARAPDWELLFARGAAYERAGRWPEAEADLAAALKLRPEEAELLNYLGYAWIDRGERLPEALGMVEKAVAANPQSGAIVDSLGWAHFRLGNHKLAVEFLEQAVELQAGDPEINNHLGDAYWMIGRKDEAVFQWRRVLTLKPDDKIRADAEGKLASGLGPTPKLAGP